MSISLFLCNFIQVNSIPIFLDWENSPIFKLER